MTARQRFETIAAAIAMVAAAKVHLAGHTLLSFLLCVAAVLLVTDDRP